MIFKSSSSSFFGYDKMRMLLYVILLIVWFVRSKLLFGTIRVGTIFLLCNECISVILLVRL